MKDAIEILLAGANKFYIDEENGFSCKMNGQKAEIEEVISQFLEKRSWFLNKPKAPGNPLKIDSGRKWLSADSGKAGISTKEARFKLAGKLFRF